MREWDFNGQLAMTLKIAAFILAFLCLLLFVRPSDTLLWGFLVGIAVGMWNAFFLARRMRAIVDMAAPKANMHMKAGFALRFSIMFAVLFYVARTPGINLYAAGAGFFVVPLIFTVGAFCNARGICKRKPEEANSIE
ncbi:MAG: ATP synthase I chain [Firmicutes bacterium ADurb.Bin373]|nr:ATP synthase subunit I [Bacillota bacterium]OQA07665.1 MAG: ATP synthase I chain [Firmicutes bacterium ADurb.Bin373]